jgi:hypothetical protein
MAELIPWQILRTDLRAHRDSVVRDWVQLLDDRAGEVACLNFLKNHAGFFFCDSGRRLLAISELELGADFRADFVVADDLSSYGFYYEFIEIEDPNEAPYTSKKQPSARLSGAVSQIMQWRKWLEANRESAKKILPSHEFWTNDNLPAKYTIIIGRRKDMEDWTGLRNQYSNEIDIRIRSFDQLTEVLQEQPFGPVPNLASGEMDGVESIVRNALVNPFRTAISSAEWRKVAPRLFDYHMAAKNAETLVGLASTNARLVSFLADWEALPAEKRDFYLEQTQWLANPVGPIPASFRVRESRSQK